MPLIRADYERCHPDEALEDIKRRAQLSKYDKGLLRRLDGVAAVRATSANKTAAADLVIPTARVVAGDGYEVPIAMVARNTV
ncbi:hypothetical protein RFN28_05460 [Mesorhizobium sp. VK24D]|uniref:Uncharacterized protein n=1 Tax=Mesorhizobium album TaxID=3072314 RepID=A0ABU4XT93_9HYPH|nr:hypothetical protein [Mesorhizobium sp. VK24D]MDX8477930.1 hypothetical protein [Mesorhizobium sp. VK24D]